MSSVEASVLGARRRSRRFGIAWRNRVLRSIHDVAVLDADAGGYQFQYRADVKRVEEFQPFIGFPDLGRVYKSERLWPFFDLRVMDRKRPDYEQYVNWLGLSTGADRLDILARNGGEQKGDTVSLAEAPAVDDSGETAATFIARGSGYAVRSSESQSAVAVLRRGQTLDAQDDTTNEANPAAILLTAAGAPVGWIPDLLIEYAREVVRSGGRITVLQNNGPSAPWHMRLLVRVSGRVAPGWSPFSGVEWPAPPASWDR
jgi:hypothetical protein